MTQTASVQVSASGAPKKVASKKTPAATASASKATASKTSKTTPRLSTGEMVNAAITALKDRKGSSLQAIKKYVASTYKIDLKKHSHFIKKYLKSAVEKNTIIQAKGTGASGRFKLAQVEKVKPTKKPAAAKKPTEKSAAMKKAPSKVAAKTPAKKQPVVKKAAAKAVKPKSPSKTTGKAPAAAKPKMPKPKKATVPKTKK